MRQVLEAPTQSSPEYLQTSLAAAMVLGARGGRFYRDIKLHCVNLLLTYDEGCRANCAYCGLARERPGDNRERSFIRVEWPLLSMEEILDRLARYREEVRRVCLSMVLHPRAYGDTIDVIRRLRERVDIPVSVLISPSGFDRERMEKLRESGADMVGIGLDAASPRVFERTRGKGVRSPLSWEQYWETLQMAREVFGPFRVNAHIVVGIGETDRELVGLFHRLREIQVSAYLFSFYPEPGSAMARRRRPSLARFRRLQLVKYLMERGEVEAETVGFDGRGGIGRLGAEPGVVETAIASGLPFLTGGCPDGGGQSVCTRPFGSYRPGQPFRDFPFPPDEGDLAGIRKELRLGGMECAP
ncbi:MAG: radical SAM protein [Dehalococcoidia bacterium]